MTRKFKIEFDVLAGHHPGTGATLSSDSLNPSGWRSIGNAAGGKFVNATGSTIVAIYLKTLKTGDSFDIDANSGGTLFDTIWLKRDGTEAYFMDARVPDSSIDPVAGRFWMRVPPNTDTEISACDSSQECPFLGQAFAQNPANPTGSDWSKIKAAREGLSPTFLTLRDALPSDSRNIIHYGEAPDGSKIAFIANGQLYVYNHDSGQVSELGKQETIVSRANRITIHDDAVTLWNSGRSLRTYALRDKAAFKSVR